MSMGSGVGHVERVSPAHKKLFRLFGVFACDAIQARDDDFVLDVQLDAARILNGLRHVVP